MRKSFKLIDALFLSYRIHRHTDTQIDRPTDTDGNKYNKYHKAECDSNSLSYIYSLLHK